MKPSILSWTASMALIGLGACASPQHTPAVSSTTPATAQDTTVKRYSANVFFETVGIYGAFFSHDESKLLTSMNRTGIYNVYAQPVAGGEPSQLTTSDTESMYGVSFFPNDDRFLFTYNQGGNELDHLYVMDPQAGARDLTPGDKLKAAFLDWSGDKTQFYAITNERDPKAFDVYRYHATTYARELFFKNEGEFGIRAISPDGRYVALTKQNSNRDSDVLLWDSRKPADKPKIVTPAPGDVSHDVAAFSRDSKTLYYSTDGHGEFVQVWSHDIASGAQSKVIAASWDVQSLSFSESGRYRIVVTNEDARSVLRITDMQTGSDLALPQVAGNVTSARFSPSDTKLAFFTVDARSPSTLHVLDLASGEHRALIDGLNPAVDAADLVDAQVVRYPSFDGLEIPAILYRPKDATAKTPVPALVHVHGGPGGQSRVGYSAEIQYLVNQGYAVLAVNNRGSSGYGKTFHHLDDRNHGEGDLKDCIYGRKYLESLDWIDGKRVGIMGGSYGGYMVLAALAFAPEAFEVGIDIFGVSNWLRTLESVPPWWASFRQSLYAELGDPATDKERLHRISPLFHAANIKRPLLVIQGANDPRVLKVESDEIVEAVKKSGVPVEYLVFDDEGHGFTKRKNQISAAETMLRFLSQHL